MFAGATRTIAAVALAGAMVAGRVRYLHFAAIRGICEVDPCSPVHTFLRPVWALWLHLPKGNLMQAYVITSSENMELAHLVTGVTGTLLHFGVMVALWRIMWCALHQIKSPMMKITGLMIYWVVWVIMLAVWLALNEDPLFASASMRFGILTGAIIGGIICMMIAIDILLRAYMHKQQDEHHEEVFT